LDEVERELLNLGIFVYSRFTYSTALIDVGEEWAFSWEDKVLIEELVHVAPEKFVGFPIALAMWKSVMKEKRFIKF